MIDLAILGAQEYLERLIVTRDHILDIDRSERLGLSGIVNTGCDLVYTRGVPMIVVDLVLS